jgi:DNA-binding beta-propeller fold protein YncE
MADVKMAFVLLATSCLLAAAPGPARARMGATPSAESRLFFLDIRGGRVVSTGLDGSDVKVLVDGRRSTPDGIVVDVESGHVYWTNMGRPMADDGSIERADIDGRNLTTIVPAGGTFTAKQLKLDKKNGKLYWADREGMRIQRSNLDGSRVETLVETGRGDDDRWDARRWCVGMAVDVAGGKIYWTQKGGDDAGVGRILRAGIDVPNGQDPAHREDVEVLFDGLPEPIDLDLDLTTRTIYWTDRGNLPGGNSVARAPMDPPKGVNPWTRTDRRVLVDGLHEGIGIALDLAGGRMYVTDLAGDVYSARLDGSDKRTLLTGQGTLTGIAVAYVR